MQFLKGCVFWSIAVFITVVVNYSCLNRHLARISLLLLNATLLYQGAAVHIFLTNAITMLAENLEELDGRFKTNKRIAVEVFVLC